MLRAQGHAEEAGERMAGPFSRYGSVGRGQQGMEAQLVQGDLGPGASCFPWCADMYNDGTKVIDDNFDGGCSMR